ncbi:hypothetical protein RI367_001001 [Sorochytrium milnesiophthora]
MPFGYTEGPRNELLREIHDRRQDIYKRTEQLPLGKSVNRGLKLPAHAQQASFVNGRRTEYGETAGAIMVPVYVDRSNRSIPRSIKPDSATNDYVNRQLKTALEKPTRSCKPASTGDGTKRCLDWGAAKLAKHSTYNVDFDKCTPKQSTIS